MAGLAVIRMSSPCCSAALFISFPGEFSLWGLIPATIDGIPISLVGGEKQGLSDEKEAVVLPTVSSHH